MKIILMSYCLAPNDAVSNDIFIFYDKFTEKGYDVSIFCEIYLCEKKRKMIDFADLKIESTIGNNLIIYHHSIYWPLPEEIIKNATSKMILKYHNVTPPDFFQKYNENYAFSCEKGIHQISEYSTGSKFEKLIGDSIFNTDEMKKYGAKVEKLDTIPPLMKINDFSSCLYNKVLINKLITQKSIMFVGRIVPNKGHKHLLRTVYYYKKYFDNNILLYIIGKWDNGLRKYNNEIYDLIDKLNLNDNVNIIDDCNFRDLHTYYSYCKVFLLMSEHEGFCVPIIEAQYHQLPVIALNKCAVGETLGNGQIMFDELDYLKFATAINVVLNNDNYKYFIVGNGIENLQKYNTESVIQKWEDLINETIK